MKITVSKKNIGTQYETQGEGATNQTAEESNNETHLITDYCPKLDLISKRTMLSMFW